MADGGPAKLRLSGVTLYVGSDNERDSRLFCFEKGCQHRLVIQSKSFIPPGYSILAKNTIADREVLSNFYDDLEKIETLLLSLEFRTNWAYLVTKSDGNFRLIYRERILPQILCPTWAPLVDEKEIIYTKWITAEDREGIWNGREVDVLLGWNERWRRVVEKEMNGHRLMRGLDLTYEVLGHVTRDEQVTGLMLEPAYGRRIEFQDRADVYAAITKVQRRGLIYSVDSSSIMISSGKVRLLGLSSVREAATVPTNQDLADMETYHWQALDIIFDELKQHPNPFAPPRAFIQLIEPFFGVPFPERPLTDGLDFFFRLFKYYVASTTTAGPPTSPSQNLGLSRSSHGSRFLSDRVLPRASDSDDDPPYRASHLHGRRRDSFHPYMRIPGSRRVLMSSADSDQTSEGESTVV